MARARNIKPGFFKNEDLAELPAEIRLLFIGLWTLADREGRMEDRPRRIKAELFPFDSFDVDPMLNHLQTKSFIVRYEVSGERFLQVVNFVKHQDPHYKERASEIPAPPGGENLIKASGITRETRARIMERDGYRCRACASENYLSIDHIVPASRGGSGEDSNLQVLCQKCNASKGNKLDGEKSGTRRSLHNDTSLQTRAKFDSTSEQHSRASPGSIPLNPESGFLNPDSLNPDVRIQPRTPAGDAAIRMKAAGLQAVNPSHPKLVALLDAGITADELAQAAGDAVAKGKNFAYALATAEGRRRDAAVEPLPERASITVPSREGPDPALARLAADRAAWTPPAPEVKAMLAQTVARLKGATA